MFRFVFFAAILSLNCFAAPPEANEDCFDGKQHYRATIRHIEGGGIGYKDGYTTLEVFLASDPSQRTVTPFLDGRGHIFDNGKWAANAGVGLRALWKNRVYGINAYYDYRNAGRFHSNQIGVGLETLGELFDFRINGYLPVGEKISTPYDPTFGTFSGNYMLVSQKYQSAMKGAGAEFGFHLGKFESSDFYAAVGPYYFIGDIDPATWGGKARISGTFKELLTLEISDSYDQTFHNKFQGQISLNFSFGPKSKVKERGRTCTVANTLNDRMLQPVGRQEIIVIDNTKKNTFAIDPSTGLPYFFVFVDNTSSSDGTYESPYHTLTQAQDNSSPNDIIYIFPGDGTTTGMNSGIALQANQKFWGSGISHSLQTSEGTISIPAQSSSSPTITNTNIDTDGNAITLAANNAISGFTITSTMNDAIYGTDPQSLEVSSCTIENTTTYAIQASFSGDASISITNNQFLDNANGVILTLEGTSTVVCSDNTFTGQTSVSSIPLEISADSNSFAAYIENNVFNANRTGSITVDLTDVINADLIILNNTITNNGTGYIDTSGSSVVIAPTGTTDYCSIVLSNNTFSDNTFDGDAARSLYLQDTGAFTTLEITASTNTMSNNGGSALVLATPVDTLTLLATDNVITGCIRDGISIISSTTTTTGTITIDNNTITEIGDISIASNGISIAQEFSNLDLTILNNEINGCAGSGILCFSTEFTDMTANISDNVISNCQNDGGGNGASGISLDTYLTLVATVENNTLSDNTSPSVAVGFYTSGDPNVCLTLTGNSSNVDPSVDPSYSLTNPGAGAFNLGPCNAYDSNSGVFSTTGSITSVRSCPGGIACP